MLDTGSFIGYPPPLPSRGRVRARVLIFFGMLLEKKDDRIKRLDRIKAYLLGWRYSFYALLLVVTLGHLVLSGQLARGH